MKLPLLPQDKANHVAYGALLACLGSFVAPELGAVLCFVFAIGKELYDHVTKNGTPDSMDAVATAAGGALVILPQVLR